MTNLALSPNGLKQFTASNFEGECTIHEGFEPYLIAMNTIAAKYGITVVVIDSLRKQVEHLPGQIVPPAKMSNHIVGHAVDVNLKYDGMYLNSHDINWAFKTQNKKEVKLFIRECIESGFRWGGLFSTPDPVHFDDGLNIHHFNKWYEIFNELA